MTALLEVEGLRNELPVSIFRPSVVVGDSRTGETAKYDGIYYLIHYLRKNPGLLRLVNVGNKNVRAPADIEQGITEARRANRESVLFLVVGRGGQRYVALKTPQT